MKYKRSYYFLLFDGRGDEPAVAINTRTGGTYAFSQAVLPEIKRLLQNPNAGNEGKLFQFLLDEHIIIPEELDELEQIKQFHRAGRHSKDELYVTYSMTNACNFRCRYCYQEHKKDVLDGKSIKKTFGYIRQHLPDFNSLRVHWFGGEPLLRLRSIEEASRELLRICEEHGKPYTSGITTNGSLLTKDAALRLLRCCVSQIQITFDGARSIHDDTRLKKNGGGSYDAVMNGLAVAIEAGFFIFIRVNLSKKSEANLEELLLDFHRRGWGPKEFTIYINEMKQHSNSLPSDSLYFPSVANYAESFVEALQTLKRFGYPIPRIAPVDVNCIFDKPSSVLFGVDGNLYHCTTGTDRALGTLGEFGDIVVEGERRKAIHSREPWDDLHCASCTSLPTCMGGCAYLDEEGKVKCNPEGFVIEKLLRLRLPDDRKLGEKGYA